MEKPKRTRLSEQELIGRRFGKLKVLAETVGSFQTYRMMDCQCECGKTKWVRLSSLLNGGTTSCGCTKRGFKTKHPIPSAGTKFGRLTVIREGTRLGVRKERALEVVCECGTELSVRLDALRHNRIRSCGCLRDEHYESLRSNAPDEPLEDNPTPEDTRHDTVKR